MDGMRTTSRRSAREPSRARELERCIEMTHLTDVIAQARRDRHPPRMLQQPILDARTIPGEVRHAQIFAQFDALAVGEAFILVHEHYPLPLLRQFQTNRPGQLDWSVLEAGPLFRVEIRKRDASVARGVDEYLTCDHRRLDRLMEESKVSLRASDLAEAARRFEEFACGLNRHIDAEENILFPVFEEKTGMTGGGPTYVMRMEHVQIRKAMSDAAAALAAGDAAGYATAAAAIESVLVAHNSKEEQILYPMIDRIAGEEGGAALAAQVQAMEM